MERSDTGSRGADAADRRRFLKALGAVGAAGLAGCAGDDGDDETDAETPTGTTEPGDETDAETPTATTTATPTTTEEPDQGFGDDPRSLVTIAGNESASPGETVTLGGDVVNAYLFPVRSVEVTIGPPADGWEVTATGPTSFEEIPSQGSESVAWEVTIPEDADGEYTVAGTISYESDTDQAEVDLSHDILVLTAGAAPEEGLEAYFPLDGDTPTNEITGAEATVYGDPSPGAAGATEDTGDAVAFDGEDDAVASGEELPIDGDAATIGGWVRFTGDSTETWTRLFTVAPDPTTPFNEVAGYQVFYQDGGLWLVGFTAAGESAVVTDSLGNFIEPGTWYFVGITIDEGTYTVYAYDAEGAIDGFPQAVDGSMRNKSESQHLVMPAGTDDFDSTYYTACEMDEVRAYSRALAEDEMFRLYTGSGGSA
jgi:hypothetical protein